jgi:excisionase family DNA binding protein
MVRKDGDIVVYTVKELADYLRIHTNTIYRWIRAGKIEAIQVGTNYRITQEAVDKLKTAVK